MNKYDKDFLNALKPQKVSTLGIIVKRFFTTVDGTEINKSTAPASLQTDYPVYLFGKFDGFGGYRIASYETPPLVGYSFIRTFVRSDGYDFTQFSGLNDLNPKINIGDQVFLYADDPLKPSYFIWIVLSVPNKSLGSIVYSIDDNGYQTRELRMYTDNTNQFFKDLGIVRADRMGDHILNQITPTTFRDVNYQQDDLAVIKFKKDGMILTPYVGFTTYMLFNTDRLYFEFEFVNVK